MAIESTVQIHKDKGGMLFQTTAKIWEEMTTEDIHKKLMRSDADIAGGRLYTQDEVDLKMQEVL